MMFYFNLFYRAGETFSTFKIGGFQTLFQAIIERLEEEALLDTEEEIVSEDEEIFADKDVVPEDEEYFFPSAEELNQAKAPEIGMLFASVKEAQKFVNVYGQLVGFSVIKGSNYMNKKIMLQCNRSRKPKQKNVVAGQNKRKRLLVDRTDCPMRVMIKLHQGSWEITGVDLKHNHPMVCSPSLTKFFLKHRYMTDIEKQLSRTLQESRIKPRKIMAIFRKMSGSLKCMHFLKDDINNLKQQDRRKIMKNTDMDRTIEYVKKIQIRQPGFFYTMNVDENNVVKSIFWTDVKARLNYSLYGEYVSFDTTYSTNKYNMPFAPIVGVNGHGRTIVFGWALLEDQKAETFKWLLTTFFEVMGGKKPDIIMTDQDAAMKKAIRELIPEVVHRNCFWHITRNAREHLGTLINKREGFAKDLEYLIYDSFTEEEFETGWQEMLEKHEIQGNKHLKSMYESRNMWVPVFLKTFFCPFTKSTGRSESTNSNFKDYVHPKDSIEKFLEQYELFEEEQKVHKDKDRYETTVQKPKLQTMKPIEKHAANIYTRNIYLKFLEQLQFSDAYTVEEIEKDKSYKVVKLMKYTGQEFDRDTFVVQVKREENMFECICAKYKRDGILCSHVLRLFTQLGIHEIPENYIKERWRSSYFEEAMKKQKMMTVDSKGNQNGQEAMLFAIMMTRSASICESMSKDFRKSQKYMDELEKLVEKIENEFAAEQQLESAGSTSVYKDPVVQATTSVRKGQRLLRPAEKKKKTATTKKKKTVTKKCQEQIVMSS
jgi:hypothetical protein